MTSNIGNLRRARDARSRCVEGSADGISAASRRARAVYRFRKDVPAGLVARPDDARTRASIRSGRPVRSAARATRGPVRPGVAWSSQGDARARSDRPPRGLWAPVGVADHRRPCHRFEALRPRGPPGTTGGSRGRLAARSRIVMARCTGARVATIGIRDCRPPPLRAGGCSRRGPTRGLPCRLLPHRGRRHGKRRACACGDRFPSALPFEARTTGSRSRGATGSSSTVSRAMVRTAAAATRDGD